MKKIIFAILEAASLIAVCACGDSSTSNKNDLPDEVSTKKELANLDCNADATGSVVYVRNLEVDFECDGESWSKLSNESKSETKSKRSSSSGKSNDDDEDENYSNGNDDDEDLNGGKSDENNDKLCSDSKSDNEDNDDESNGGESSSDSQSSSSKAVPTSYADAKVMPAGTYNCYKYSCAGTSSLNQEMLAAGEYGEVLDERTEKVYRTVNIGDRDWTTQSAAYVATANNNDSLCPPGWRAPRGEEWQALQYHHAAESMTFADWLNALRSTEDKDKFSQKPVIGTTNTTGFSACTSPLEMSPNNYTSGGIFYKCQGSCCTAKLDNLGDITYSRSIGCKGEYSSMRCISNDIIDKRCHTDQIDTCKYGKLIDERDGQEYETVEINGLVWMNEYLRFRDTVAVKSLVHQHSCADSNCTIIKYSMAAAFDSLRTGCGYETNCEHGQGICPDGWHIATESDVHHSYDYIVMHTPVEYYSSSADTLYGFKVYNGIPALLKNEYVAFNSNNYPLALYNISSQYHRTSYAAVRCVKNRDN